MRFIQTADGSFLNTHYITFVYRNECDICARLSEDESIEDYCLYEGTSHQDAIDQLEDIMKQIGGGV